MTGGHTQSHIWVVAWHSGNMFCPIQKVNLHHAGLVLRQVQAQAGNLFRYVISRLGQLSLPSLRGR